MRTHIFSFRKQSTNAFAFVQYMQGCIIYCRKEKKIIGVLSNFWHLSINVTRGLPCSGAFLLPSQALIPIVASCLYWYCPAQWHPAPGVGGLLRGASRYNPAFQGWLLLLPT